MSPLDSNKLAALTAQVLTEPLERSDAIICLEGDGYHRIDHAVKLFQDGWAPLIVYSGGVDRPPFSLPRKQAQLAFKRSGIGADRLIFEDRSEHTQAQAVAVLALAKQRGWRRLIVVASHFHQLRAYLTFLQEMWRAEVNVKIINSPAVNLYWYEKCPGPEQNRTELFQSELEKISQYASKGHIASLDAALDYQQRKLS